ncbi:unnamed protein product, partial [marine sediment metagenome]
ARKISIADTVAGWESSMQLALLKDGTGDGLVEFFTKVTSFINDSENTYDIDQASLFDEHHLIFAVATIAPAEAYPPGTELEVEYTGTMADGTDGTHPAITTAYIRKELARACGQDKLEENLACGEIGGFIKMYYEQGGVPQTPIVRACYLFDSMNPTDTTYGMRKFKADAFEHATHDAITITKVVLIPTDTDEAHAYAEQITGAPGWEGPYNLTLAGGIDITFETDVDE